MHKHKRIRPMDVELAAAKGGAPEKEVLRRARYRYVKQLDVRDDQLGYGDTIEVRFLAVTEGKAVGFVEKIHRTRSGRVIEEKEEEQAKELQNGRSDVTVNGKLSAEKDTVRFGEAWDEHAEDPIGPPDALPAHPLQRGSEVRTRKGDAPLRRGAGKRNAGALSPKSHAKGVKQPLGLKKRSPAPSGVAGKARKGGVDQKGPRASNGQSVAPKPPRATPRVREKGGALASPRRRSESQRNARA